MKKLIIASFLIGSFVYAQEPASTNPIETQFSNLIEKSNNFQDYKVVKKLDLDKLKTNTDTYILQLDNKIAGLEKEIAAENEAQSALEKALSASKSEVNNLDRQKDSISIMGFLLDKSIYNIIVWSIVAILSLILIILFLQFKKSNAITRQARMELATAEVELEELRRKSIEEKQRLGRQLQDERNKLSRLRTAN